jgi:NAD(P)-dependent dehydrogenase (short-subunit alcohol dehydrogenase family)
MVGKAMDEYGRIDILCNVAGAILHADGVPIDEQEPAMWERQLRLNVIGTMNVSQAVVPAMRAHKYGAIVNIGSGSTHAYAMGVSSYAMSKYAIDLFTKQLAFVEARNGIRVNCVAPGPAETNFAGLLKENPDVSLEEAEKMRQEMLGHFPLGRICTPGTWPRRPPSWSLNQRLVTSRTDPPRLRRLCHLDHRGSGEGRAINQREVEKDGAVREVHLHDA